MSLPLDEIVFGDGLHKADTWERVIELVKEWDWKELM